MASETNIIELSEQHYDEYMRINCEAYPGMEVFTAEERAGLVENMRLSTPDPRTSRYGAFRDDNMVGGMKLFDYVMNVRGALLPTGGVGAIAVDLMHKKAHVAKELMVYYLDHYMKRHYPMGLLWPFRSDFYHDMGFGLGGRMFRYSILPSTLPAGLPKQHVRYLNVDDVPAITECHNRFAATHPGMVQQTDLGWGIVLRQRRKARYVGVAVNGRIEGYLSYTFKKIAADSFLVNDLIVEEIVYLNREALWEMLAFLRSQLDQVRRIILHTGEDEFYFLLSDPRNESTTIIHPTHQESHVAGVGVMYRVLNIPLLLEQLGPKAFAEIDLTVNLTVTDSFIPSNDGSLVVSFRQGTAEVVKTNEFEVEIGLDIAEFSSMIMGAVGFHSLYNYGLATISRPELVDTIDRLFATDRRPLTTVSF